nr:zinc finger, CCHC-type [Tanacetum cinerariifolium]
MAAAAMKHMATNFAKLEKFEGVDFRRWQKRMHFLLSSMSVVYVLTTPIYENVKNATVEQFRKRAKWDNDDYVCKGLILNCMSDPLFGIYQIIESSKELWDSLEAKYMTEDASRATVHVCKDRCWFKTYDSLNDGSILHMGNESTALMHGLGCVEVTEEVATKQPGPELRKSKKNRIPKNFGPKFQLYLIERTRVEVDLTKEFLSSKFSMKYMGEADVILGIRIKHESNKLVISKSHYTKKALKKFNYFNCTLVSTLVDTSKKLMPNNGQAVSQLEYSRVIGCLMYAMTCTRPDIAFAVGKLSRYTFNPGTQYWQAIQRASKKQTFVTGSTIKPEFVALAAADKEAEWLRNLILEIPLWSKPISHISIRCDSAATLAKAYIQMYNGKSRHLGIRHNMICELITNGVISIEFVRSQQNLADHLTKGLARDLVLKSVEGMGLKSNQVTEC